jgi:hypothetical protein
MWMRAFSVISGCSSDSVCRVSVIEITFVYECGRNVQRVGESSGSQNGKVSCVLRTAFMPYGSAKTGLYQALASRHICPCVAINRGGLPLYPIRSTWPPCFAILRAWYCMRGLRPMSPSTTICTVTPQFEDTCVVLWLSPDDSPPSLTGC